MRATGRRVPETITIGEVSRAGPANGLLREGDVVLSANGTAITGAAQLRGIISKSLRAAAWKAGRVSQCSAKVIRDAWALGDSTSSIRSCMYQISVVIMTSAWVSVAPQA